MPTEKSKGRTGRRSTPRTPKPPLYGKGKVVHHLPGRLRLRVSSVKGNPAALAKIADTLGSVDGVSATEVNPVTGGILVHYDPQLHDAIPSTIARVAESSGLFLLESAMETLEGFEGEHSLVATGLIDFVKEINQQVSEATGNSVDLRVLVPLGALVLAATYFTVEMGTPFWVMLTLFAFNSFVMFHRPAPIVVSRATCMAAPA